MVHIIKFPETRPLTIINYEHKDKSKYKISNVVLKHINANYDNYQINRLLDSIQKIGKTINAEELFNLIDDIFLFIGDIKDLLSSTTNNTNLDINKLRNI